MSDFIEDLKQLWGHYGTFFIVGFIVLVLGVLAFFSPYFLARMSGEDWSTGEVVDEFSEDGLPPLAANRSVATGRTEIRSLHDLLFLHHDAMGGRQAIERIQSARLVGVITEDDGNSKDFVIVKRRPRMVRMNLTSPSVRLTYVFNGSEGQYRITTAQGSAVHSMNAEQLRNFEFDSEIFSPISDPARVLSNLTYSGLVEFAGEWLHKVEFRRTELVTDHYFLDPQTFLITHLQRERNDTDVRRTEFFHYFEYRLIDGIPVPFQVRQRLVAASEESLHVRFTQVEWNAGLFSHAFSMNLE